MIKQRKIQLAAVIATVNGVLALSFAASPCHAGNCFLNRPYYRCVYDPVHGAGTPCGISDFQSQCYARCLQTSSCKKSNGVLNCTYNPTGTCAGVNWRLECDCVEGDPD